MVANWFRGSCHLLWFPTRRVGSQYAREEKCHKHQNRECHRQRLIGIRYELLCPAGFAAQDIRNAHMSHSLGPDSYPNVGIKISPISPNTVPSPPLRPLPWNATGRSPDSTKSHRPQSVVSMSLHAIRVLHQTEFLSSILHDRYAYRDIHGTKYRMRESSPPE